MLYIADFDPQVGVEMLSFEVIDPSVGMIVLCSSVVCSLFVNYLRHDRYELGGCVFRFPMLTI